MKEIEQNILNEFSNINNKAYHKYDNWYHEFGNGSNIAKLIIIQHEDYLHVEFQITQDRNYITNYFYDTPTMLFNDLRDSYEDLYENTTFKCIIIPYNLPINITNEENQNSLNEIDNYLKNQFNTNNVKSEYDLSSFDGNIKVMINSIEFNLQANMK